jgi:hypothetical protein
MLVVVKSPECRGEEFVRMGLGLGRELEYQGLEVVLYQMTRHRESLVLGVQ